MSAKDPIVSLLGDAHRTIVDAAKMYVAGDQERAANELDDVVVLIRDAIADIRRAVAAPKETGA